MGKLFAAILVAAPVAAFSIWAYLAQTERVWNETDLRSIEHRIERAEFDRDFYEMRGAPRERIEEMNQRIASLRAELTGATAAKKNHTGRGATALQAVEDQIERYGEKSADPLEKFNQ